MPLNPDELFLVYRDLHRIFPDDLHIARPLIRMLEERGDVRHARDLALTMARRMLASGRSGPALGFLEMCRRLEHPEREEIEALASMARITGTGPIEIEAENPRMFTLLEPLSDQEAMDFLRQGRLIEVREGQDIVRQGEISQTFYLILEGEMQVHLITDAGQDENLSILRPGHFFGEFACVYNLPRTATVTARTEGLLLEFSALAVSQLMQTYPLASEYLMRTVQARMVHSMTHSHPAFSGLPEADRRWVAEESRVREYRDGDPIEACDDSCCVILYGGAVARRSHEKGHLECELEPGDMFGGASRYLRLPPNTELRAKGHTLICRIPGHVFESLMNAYAGLEQWVQPHGEARHQRLSIPLEEWDLDA